MPRRRIIDPDESEEEVNTTVRPSNNNQARNSRATRASRRRARPAFSEDDEPSATQELENSVDENMDISEETPVLSGHKCPTIGEAVLTALALSSKGPIKEPDLKPLLYRGRFKDWQDGLNDLNTALSDAFGINLVYDGPSHNFFMRNDLTLVRGELNELYVDGTLDGVRIDDGSATSHPLPDADEFTDDDKKGLLFTLLTSIMMSNNVELGHKQWLVDEQILRHMCKKMKVPDEVFKKTISGYNAEFIKNGWLRKIEEKDINQDSLPRYTWGPQAIHTVSTLAVFEKYCYINKQSKIEFGNYEEILQKLDERNGLYKPR